MARRKHHLVQLEIPNTNRGGGWILAPKFEMMILETRRKLRKARLAQEELNRENKQLSGRLKRQKYQSAETRLLLRFHRAKQNRPDLSSR